jgi:dihydropteroate synthase
MMDCRRSPALPRGFSRQARLYLRPTALVSGAAADAALASGAGRRLAGGRFVFTACEVYVREPGGLTGAIAPVAEVAAWAEEADSQGAAAVLERLSAPRAAILGRAMDRPVIVGVINVTPDSFSDGGDHEAPDAAIAHGRALAAAGADILDVGGESTRPAAEPVTPERELARVLPVVRGLAAAGHAVSIDTRRAAVMTAAFEAGAKMLNDVTALTFDPASLAAAAAARVPVVLMHARGDPKTMQVDPVYEHAALDIYDYLEARIEACVAAGLERRRIIVDPGIGFGKTVEHNIDILQHLSLYHGLGCPLLLGVSRKSFIGRIADVDTPKERLPGSLAAGLNGLDQGVQMLRVHDVAETAQAVAVWNAMTAPVRSWVRS